MKSMTMRERLLAVIQGREPDRVPLIMYDEMLPWDEVQALLGDKIGLLRWSEIHRVLTPNCKFEVENFYRGSDRWERSTLHTPKGSIFQERAFEPAYDSAAIRKHYIDQPQDYEILWSYLEDSIILSDYERYHRDQAKLGEAGLPLVAVERTPWQQLWVIWVGLDRLAFHLMDCPDRVHKTIDMLIQRERKIFELAVNSPAPMIDFPDNITAPAIGLKRFEQYCVPLYNELADMLAERGMPVFVHMDGDLKPLWQAIADSNVGGIDSLSPTPDNDTSVAQAVHMWPQMRLFVNFPSSVHLRSYDEVRAEAENILKAGAHTGRLEIQFSENVPHGVWRTSFKAIADAIDAYKP